MGFDRDTVADPAVVFYGSHDQAFGELSTPSDRSDGSWPVVVLVHGGFWRERYRLDLMRPLVRSLVERGVAVWNVEYRRVGGAGGYPGTLVDVAAALDHLASMDREAGGVFDLTRVAVVGHSAGGHLAAWAASRSSLPADSPGNDPVVLPRVAVVQAGVVDLVAATARRLGDGAVVDFLGGTPDDVPERYGWASPIELLPIDARVLLVHGGADDDVPLDQSRRYADRARAEGVDVDLVVDAQAGHYEHLDPTHAMWTAVLDELAAAGIAG